MSEQPPASSRRIILLLDGTWNDAEFGATDTNIVRLRRLIAQSLSADATAAPYEARAELSPQEMVTKTTSASRGNLVYYERGVGTGTFMNRLMGGAIGVGLDDNIRRAYRFLSFHYRPGDEIFVFGFSRGSYTARSLVGFIAAAGLLLRENCTEEKERCAWDFYRTSPNSRLPGVWHELSRYMHDHDGLRIACLGVFDTVGALGIPHEAFLRANRQRFEFHNVELSSITRVNLQAVAIDENREPFQATLWKKPQFKKFQTVTEQVWFSGAHADVGGGYVDEASRGRNPYLDDVTLDWLARRLKFHFPDFPIAASLIPQLPEKEKIEQHYDGWVNAWLNNSRRGVYKVLFDKAWRSIANTVIPPAELRRREIAVGFDRHSLPINEMLHVSAFEKLGLSAPGTRGMIYRPKNVVPIMGSIERTYALDPGLSNEERIFLVDWSGRVLEPHQKDDNERANQVLARASARLKGSS